MKKSKQVSKMLGILFSMTLFLTANAQNSIDVSRGGSFYVCQGVPVTFYGAVSTGEIIESDTCFHYNTPGNYCAAPPCTIDNFTVNSIKTGLIGIPSSSTFSIVITANNAGPIVVSYDGKAGSYMANQYTFTVVPIATTISGTTNFCSSGAAGASHYETYSIPAITGAQYTWTTTPVSGTGTETVFSGQGTPTCTINYVGSGLSTYNVCVTIKGASSTCPVMEACTEVTTQSSTAATPTVAKFTYTPENSPLNCPGNSAIITLNSESNISSFGWTTSNSSFPLDSSTTINAINFVALKAYGETSTIQVTANNICGSSAPAKVNVLTRSEAQCEGGTGGGGEKSNINQTNESNTIISTYKVYPTPVSNQLTVEYPYSATPQTVTIYDMVGKTVASYELPAAQNITSLNVSNLPVGLFVYSISSHGNIVERGKMTIQR